MRRCSRCLKELPLSSFYQKRAGKDGHATICKTCCTLSSQLYWKEHRSTLNKMRRERYSTDFDHRARILAKGREWNRRMKREVLSAYSVDTTQLGCACCGEKHLEFLVLDHVLNDGAVERRAHKLNSFQFYLKLRREEFPHQERYRVLCANCNTAYGAFKYCPHNLQSLTSEESFQV